MGATAAQLKTATDLLKLAGKVLPATLDLYPVYLDTGGTLYYTDAATALADMATLLRADAGVYAAGWKPPRLGASQTFFNDHAQVLLSETAGRLADLRKRYPNA